MEHIINRISENLKNGLPGENAHLKMAPINRPLSSISIQTQRDYKESAVAVIISKIDNSPNIILMERQKYKGAHSGQISFPGGKKETSDLSILDTALRETHEEIGLQISKSDLITSLTNVYIPVSNFLVNPFLFYIPELEKSTFKPNDREVASLLYFPIEKLLDESIQSTMEIKLDNGIVQKNIPCFKFDNVNVWGATALILNELRELIL